MSTKENQNAKNSHADGLPYRIPYNSRFRFGSYLWLCSRLSKWRVGRSAVVSRNSSNARQAGRHARIVQPSSLRHSLVEHFRLRYSSGRRRRDVVGIAELGPHHVSRRDFKACGRCPRLDFYRAAKRLWVDGQAGKHFRGCVAGFGEIGI